MKKNATWMMVAAAGLAVVSSARAQNVTGDATLDNIAPGAVTAYYAAWASQPPTVVSDSANGFSVSSADYGSLYYAIPAGQQQTLNSADAYANLTFTINGPPGTYNYGVPFILDDNVDSDAYGGYAMYSPGTYTESVPLQADQQAAVAAGGDVINGLNLELDPAGLSGANYSITYDSLSLTPTPVPEPGTLQLMGLGAAGLLGFCRRKK